MTSLRHVKIRRAGATQAFLTAGKASMQTKLIYIYYKNTVMHVADTASDKSRLKNQFQPDYF
jgi:hypothetical protein